MRSAASCKTLKKAKELSAVYSPMKRFTTTLNATIRETEDVMKEIRSGQGSAGRFINDPALYNNANEIALQLKAIADDLRAGRGTAGKLLTDDEFYLRINRTADRLDKSVDQINLMIADINAGRGTLGKLIQRRTDLQRRARRDRALQHHRRTHRQHRRRRSTRRRHRRQTSQRRRALYKRESILFRRREDALRLPPKPEEVSDDQVRAFLD